MQNYAPTVVVLQCGADSISGDRLGCFNLSVEGHGECVKIVKEYNVPILLLGGGGYTLRNVPRAWAYETSIACGIELSNDLPSKDKYRYIDYFSPEYKLHMSISNMENKNTKKYLSEKTEKILDNLKKITTGSKVTISHHKLG